MVECNVRLSVNIIITGQHLFCIEPIFLDLIGGRLMIVHPHTGRERTTRCVSETLVYSHPGLPPLDDENSGAGVVRPPLSLRSEGLM